MHWHELPADDQRARVRGAIEEGFGVALALNDPVIDGLIAASSLPGMSLAGLRFWIYAEPVERGPLRVSAYMAWAEMVHERAARKRMPPAPPAGEEARP